MPRGTMRGNTKVTPTKNGKGKSVVSKSSKMKQTTSKTVKQKASGKDVGEETAYERLVCKVKENRDTKKKSSQNVENEVQSKRLHSQSPGPD